VQATILSAITSIKNPTAGTIRCHSCGEYIHDIDAKAPDDCQIVVGQEADLI
jgi:formylmethanofuran dehydrogenase subunit E